MTDYDPTPEVQDTEVLPPAGQTAEAPAVETGTAVPAPMPIAPVEQKARPSYRTYIVATVAAVVFGVMLSAVSFMAGTFVGRATRGPVIGPPAQAQMMQLPSDGSQGRGQGFGRGQSGDVPGAEQEDSGSSTGRPLGHPRGPGFGNVPGAGQAPQDAPTQ